MNSKNVIYMTSELFRILEAHTKHGGSKILFNNISKLDITTTELCHCYYYREKCQKNTP